MYRPAPLLLAISLSALGCAEAQPEPRAGEEPTNEGPGPREPESPAPGGPTRGDAGAAGQTPDDSTSPDGASADEPLSSCAVVTSEVSLLPVHLAFAFDVSGSLGKGDKPWHDKTLKWDPVVAATRAFFESPAASGLTAALTFFPSEGGEDARCSTASYTTPDVAMTALPSPVFGEAMAEIEAQPWRGGTPTAAVMRGTRLFLEEYRAAHPGRYAIVLVTDGMPQDCSDEDDTIESVVLEAEGALSDGISTYVIGVRNPEIEGAPDAVSELPAIAMAGGTTRSYLIETGDPEATAGSLQTAINTIRDASISCNLAIPAPSDGRPFDKTKVTVQYQSGTSAQTLEYDQSCSKRSAWRYDDPERATEIELCDQTCDVVQADQKAKLSVSFECEAVIVI